MRHLNVHVVFSGKRDRRINAFYSYPIMILAIETLGWILPGLSGSVEMQCDLDASKEIWAKIVKLRKEQECNVNSIKTEIQAMADSCKMQKNDNKTMEYGLKNINGLIALIERD